MKDNYSYGNIRRLCSLLPKRSYSSITTKARRIGLLTRTYWEEEELTFLLHNYDKMSVNEIMTHFPHRSRRAVMAKAMELGVQSYDSVRFTPDEVQFLKDHYMEYTDYEMGAILGRTFHAICDKRLYLGLKKCDGTSYETLYNYARKNNTDWKIRSMKNCNYRCVITGKRFDVIHHLYGFNSIITDTKLILGYVDDDIKKYTSQEIEDFYKYFKIEQDKHPLGVCLTNEYHHLFHIQYGYGNNTVEQWNEFYNTHKQI